MCGGSAGKVVFDPLGYAEAALASYAVFSRLKQDGVILASCRFQVSLPTPLAPVRAFLVEEEQANVQPAYETALFAELDTITSDIPHEELAIQWDVAIEFALLESVADAGYEQTKTGVVEQLVRLGKQVPVDVELGYHLCYGDAGHKHFVEPQDTTSSLRSPMASPLASHALSTGFLCQCHASGAMRPISCRS